MMMHTIKDDALLKIIDAITERVLRLQSKAELTHREHEALRISQKELIRYRTEYTRRSIAAGKGE